MTVSRTTAARGRGQRWCGGTARPPGQAPGSSGTSRAAGEDVRVLVLDADKAERTFEDQDDVEILAGAFDDKETALAEARAGKESSMAEIPVGPEEGLGPGEVTGAGPYAVGFTGDHYFAVSRRCRHLRADLAEGSIDAEGCLVCPWHQSAYDVTTGRMVRGPQGAYAKIPGLGSTLMLLTRLVPLRRGTVSVHDGQIYVR